MKLTDRIIPVPQKVTEGENILGKVTAYTLQCNIPEDAYLGRKAAKRLEAALLEAFGAPCEEGCLNITFSLGVAPEEIPNPDQGYSICAKEGSVEITGFGDLGLYYAVPTFLQCLQKDNGFYTLPAMELLDYPSLKTRGHFMETRYGTDMMELEDWKEVVDFMVDHKENQLTVSVYGCWQVQFDDRVSEYVFVPFEGYPELETPVIQKYFSPKENRWVEKVTKTPMYEKDFLGELMAYGRERGVQVVPMMNSLGHNTLIPRLHPEVSALDEEGKPSFTGYCTANPKTYELLFALYDQIIDRYCAPNGIDAFDIGMDEVRDGKAYLPGEVGVNRSPWCKCPVCSQKTRAEIIIDHAVKLMSHLKEKGMKTVYMYNDMVVEHKTAFNLGDPEDRTAQFCAAMEKNGLTDIACLDWWSYREMREMFQFSTIHPELGLRSTMKPWNGYYNWAFLLPAVRNNYHISKVANDENAEGMRSYSTWDRSYHRNCQVQADYAWNHAGTGKPHAASARYVRRHFPTASGKANTAFMLMDEIVRWRNSKDPNNADTSRYEIFYSHLCFYEYTYFRPGKEYPRNFPGEILTRIRESEDYAQELQLLYDLSCQASELFGEIARTPGCDKVLALRYQYEAELYKVLCGDALSLGEMDRLAQRFQETGDPALLQEIAAVAGKQKDARLAQIALLEKVKEPYLIPSHSRIQCGPMQYFADVEKYVTETPADKLQLDFSDMRHMASKRFLSLR